MNVCRFHTLLKTSCIKKWATDFVADKLAILLVLRQQVVDEREEWKQSGLDGHYAQLRKKMKRTFASLHTKYVECKQHYAEEQHVDMNRREQTPLLNYQAKGARLQDGILWDPTKQDLTEFCPHCCTMIVDNMQAIHTYNQGRQDAAIANSSNGLFAAKSPKHGFFCYMVMCGGRPDRGYCQECIRLVLNGETPSPSAGPGDSKKDGDLLAMAIIAVLPHPKHFQCPTLLPVAPLNCHAELINIDEHLMWDPTNAEGGSTIPEGIDSTLHLL